MSLLNKKRLYQYSILVSVILGIIGVFFLYFINYSLIAKAFADYEGAIQVVLIISLRILLLSIITFYLINKWFKQEVQYLTDIPFLLSIFFLILAFGKTIDVFWDLTFFTFDDAVVLFLVKIRYFIIIFEVAPLIYLGFEIVFFRMEDRFTRLKDKRFMNTLRTRLIAVIVAIESVTIIIVPNITVLGMILPIILIPSLISIVYIFYLAYRYNRLKMVKPKILTIGFLLYMMSNILRPVMQNILGETANFVILTELVDLSIFLIIFLGLYKKQ
ncbi:MAG: hypothetical protein JSV23_03870 [Promethearchaeota archaeon]|nr:MAG: hypothetical protein JSV23_03870 [Candidatus Lokiarchaeota archaeon]